MTTISASVKALCAIKVEAPKADAGSSAAGGAPASAGLDKSKLLMAKQLTSLLKEVQGLKKKLEEADRASSKQARLCSLRLSYLDQVEALAQQSKSGPVDFERMADEEEGDSALGSIPPTSSLTATPSKPQSRNARNDREMDTDSEAAAAAGSSALAASASSSAAAAAVASSSEGADSRSFTVTPQMRLDHIFADHLLRNNRPLTAARVLATHPVLPSLLDPDIFQLCRKIESSLLDSQDCSRALAWCGENRSRLNKIGSTFEFDLRLQEFLSLVRKKEPMKAIEYARKFLAPAAITTVPAPAAVTAAPPAAGTTMERTMSLPDDPPAGALTRNNSLQPTSSAASDEKKEEPAATMMVADPARLKILQEAMNLLVFFGYDDEADKEQETATKSSAAAAAATSSVVHPWHRYRVYWSLSRFPQLVRTFRETALRIYGLPSKSSLEYALHIGLGALKTSSCKCNHSRRVRDHGEEEGEQQRGAQAEGPASAASSSSSFESFDVAPTPSCPVCTYPLSCLARSLPVAQRSHSRLVCRLSGALMDERNPPMALPNGFVYSKAALTKMAQANGGVITCPRTKQTFAFSLARMVYVL